MVRATVPLVADQGQSRRDDELEVGKDHAQTAQSDRTSNQLRAVRLFIVQDFLMWPIPSNKCLERASHRKTQLRPLPVGQGANVNATCRVMNNQESPGSRCVDDATEVG